MVSAGVLDRDRVAQRLAGQQDGRIARYIARYLVDIEVRRGLDQDLCRVIVVGNIRVRCAIDVRVVTQRYRQTVVDELRLVEHVAAVYEQGHEIHLELDQHTVAQPAEAQVAYVQQPGTGRTTVRVRVAGIRARRQRYDIQRARLERRVSIETVEFVKDAEIVDSDVAQVLDVEPVAQRFSGRRDGARVLSPRHVNDRLLEPKLRQVDEDGVRVFVIPDAHGTVGQRTAVDSRGVGVEPLGRAGHVRQRGAILGIGVELRAIRDHQPLVHTDHRGGGQRVEH